MFIVHLLSPPSPKEFKSHKLTNLCFFPVSQALVQDMAIESVNWKILPKGQNATLWITVNQRGEK